MLLALPDIFRGVGINPLTPGNTSLLLWLIMGYMVATAVLVVGFGRLGDMYGRVKMYNAGFAILTVFSVLLAVTWMQSTLAVMWTIVMRILQCAGGHADGQFQYHHHRRHQHRRIQRRPARPGFGPEPGGRHCGGGFLGLIICGLLEPIDWRLVFLVSVAGRIRGCWAP
ncbi:hypothetical protein [Arthrobacter alpinus]|uniref:hypothetical protein n=1 Tax=Arthrobacter alpinus TaxID=656366 RepID=UPI001C93FD8C|nr:hypothetical protein [Arthrobacter alpinus]